MLRSLVLAALLLSPAAHADAPPPPPGVVVVDATGTVPEVVQRLINGIAKRKISLVARTPHHEAAEKAGLSMRQSVVVLFGNPKIGTPAMNAAPLMALDLPLRVLVYEDADGTTRLAYKDPVWLATRHGIAELPQIATMAEVLGALTAEAAAK